MENLLDYLKAQGAVKAAIVNGPNGDFISATKADNSTFTLPVGKKSQKGKLAEMNIIRAEDGGIIATMNNYSTVEEVSLV